MKFVAVVESSIGWYEETDTLEEAIQILRDLVEVDKSYHFAGTTTFHWQSHSSNASLALAVKWIYIDKDGIPHNKSKNIRVKDFVRGMMGRRYNYSYNDVMKAIDLE